MTVEAQITINATKAAVWAATTDIAHFAELLSGVEKIEVVSKPASGLVGLKWKETRILFGKSATVEKWITESKENEFYTTRTEQDGFVFITTNRISGSDGNVVLTGIHETQPQGFAARLKALPMVFFKGVIRKAIMKDLKDMKRAAETGMNAFGPPERVYVENDWYDGPIQGIADIGGVPHRFKAIFDQVEDEYGTAFDVWPISKDMLALEIEQWQIFVSWNSMAESGRIDIGPHPGHGGVNARWDEIQESVKHDRDNVPPGSQRAVFQFIHTDQEDRYAPSGPDYMLSWKIL